MTNGINCPIANVLELSGEEMAQVHGGAQVDFYLHVDGIDGESTASASGGGGGAGKCHFQDMSFSTNV